MNQSKKIEVSKSTFISLKAELLRKQDEVNKAKQASKNQIENFIPSSKFGKDKDDSKLSTSQSKPTPPDAEESEALRKSKEKLEKKALLYDHLSQVPSSSKDQSDEYLVNFDKKSKEDSTGNVPVASSSAPADETHYDDDSDDEWVDYIDCLGRTRRCHKTDLEHTQKQDESLKIKLSGPPPPIQETAAEKTFFKEGDVRYVLRFSRPKEFSLLVFGVLCRVALPPSLANVICLDDGRLMTATLSETLAKEADSATRHNTPKTNNEKGDVPEKELQHPDAYKEQLRKQWEQKEEEIMMKDKVHYEDVLFNEAPVPSMSNVRKICYLCPSKARRMTKHRCTRCRKAICGPHNVDMCRHYVD